MMILTKKQNDLLTFYMNDEAEQLNRICRSLFGIIGNVEQKDEDDLFSIAAEVLWDSVKRYNEESKIKFNTFLINNIKNKYNTYVRDNMRDKRCSYNETKEIIDGKEIIRKNKIFNVSIDEEFKDGISYGEKIASKFDVFEELFGDELSEKVLIYIKQLSKLQKKILFLLAEDYSEKEIAEILNISNKDLHHNIHIIRDYKTVRCLL